MGKCSDYATGKLDLDLDDEVPRSALADCLDSGWTADEIAEELGLEGEGEVVRWCLYHDLPLPKAAAAAKAPQEIASQPAAQEMARPRYVPQPTTTPEYQRARHLANALKYKRRITAAKRAAIEHERRRRVAAYLLFGTYTRAAALCGCTPEGIKSTLEIHGVARIAKRTPPAVEVERTMRNFGFDDKTIQRAMKHAKG